MVDPFRIGIVGAPSSGKSVFSSRLQAELQERGLNSSKLVSEYALEHLGQGKPISTLKDQAYVSQKQIEAEIYAEECNFNPIICDSAVWIGAMYVKQGFLYDTSYANGMSSQEFTTLMGEYMKLVLKVKYDLIVYIPLFGQDSHVNKFRLHDNASAIELDGFIQQYLLENKDIYFMTAPKSLSDREHFVKYLASLVIEKVQ